MKAHDVRHLCICGLCGSIGDNRKMLSIDFPRSDYGIWKNVTVHGACAYAKLGEDILTLPFEQRTKLTISDVGIEMMQRLVRCDDA